MFTGILGGSFNPVHNGHLSLARQLAAAVGLDEVWLMVTPQNPLKAPGSLLADDIRLRLVRQALDGDPVLKASDYEFHLPRPSYTWNTLQALSADYPDRRFALLIGGDNWQLFPRWYHSADILAHYPVIVYPRKDSPTPLPPEDSTPLPPETSSPLPSEESSGAATPLPSKGRGQGWGISSPKGEARRGLPPGLHVIPATLLDISSTMIRRRVLCGQSISGLVPPQIESAVVRLYSHPRT